MAAIREDELVLLDDKIRSAEASLFASYGFEGAESSFDLLNAQVRLRVLTIGCGTPIVMLHGVTLAAAVWAPLVALLGNYRVHLVELPGHGLSGPFNYRAARVREHSVLLLDELFDALDLHSARVVGHSLGGMFALWHAGERPGRIASLVAIGEPAGAVPGVTLRMPLSLLTVPVLGTMMLRTPSTQSVYRQLLGEGLGRTAGPCRPCGACRCLAVVRAPQGQRSNRRVPAARAQRIPTSATRERHERRGAWPN